MDKGAENYLKYLKGDESGLAAIIAEYRDGLILYANGIVCNMAAAEDIAEDTFVRLITKKPSFGRHSAFRTWLFGIARNLCYDALRREKFISAEPPDEDGTDGESVEMAYIKLEARQKLYAAMKKLPSDRYELIWLSYFEDMTAKEIGKVTGKTEAAVFMALSRARAQLKEILIKEGFTYEDV